MNDDCNYSSYPIAKLSNLKNFKTVHFNKVLVIFIINEVRALLDFFKAITIQTQTRLVDKEI